MTRLRDIIPENYTIKGEKADYNTQVKDRELEFTDWGYFCNQYGPGFILQFYDNGKPFVFITHSKEIQRTVELWESKRGKEPFVATVTEKRTKKGHRVYIFK